MIDTHSHIIPGIDDGAKDDEMAVKMLKIWSYVNILDTKSQTFLCCTSS